MEETPGTRLRKALQTEKPLQIVGTINAYTAMMAQQVGFKAIYLSGAGVANYSYGLPDLGITTLDNVLEDVDRITSRVSLPLLVDIDTGFGGAFNIARTIQQLIKLGAAAIHIEDQVQAKRCGHRPGKAIVPPSEMVDRIKAAVDARTDPSFVIMARTDAIANEGIERALERIQLYKAAGADMIFPEAITRLEDYKIFHDTCDLPILANMTEFGLTPLLTAEELHNAGVAMVLYPLSAARAMNQAALSVYQAIKQDGTQKSQLPHMQTREDLYKFLDYYVYEKKLDDLF